jgi:hypothetical protein
VLKVLVEGANSAASTVSTDTVLNTSALLAPAP